MTFGDINAAIRMRELITTIAEGVVERLRPEERIGKVYSYNKQAQTAQVWFPGETVSSLVTVRFAMDKIPSKAMIESFSVAGYDAPGDLVRVAGKPGAYYILDYVSGIPQKYQVEAAVAGLVVNPHSNPSFDSVVNSTYVNGSSSSVASRPIASNWGTFWGGAGAVFGSDSATWNGATGYSVKTTLAANTYQGYESTVFSVKPGSIITVKIRVKTTGPGFSMTIFSSDVTNHGFFDGNAQTQQQTSAMIQPAADGVWREYTHTAVVGSGRTKAKVYIRPTAGASNPGEIWIDDSHVTVDETGLFSANDIVANNDLKGKQLYVNDRRIYENPVLNSQHGSMSALATSFNDNVVRDIYVASNIPVPTGTRVALISMQGGGLASINAACHWRSFYMLGSGTGGPYVERGYTLCHNGGEPAYDMRFDHTYEVNIPSGTTNIGLKATCSSDSAGGGVLTKPGAYQVTFKG